VVRKAYKLYQLGGVVSEILYSPAAYGLDMSVKNMPKPRARISPQVRVLLLRCYTIACEIKEALRYGCQPRWEFGHHKTAEMTAWGVPAAVLRCS
jgi:hypothetical protein